MGESFALGRQNARDMLERSGTTDPAAQAMEEVAENVNSMDQGVRKILLELNQRLQKLSDSVIASGSSRSLGVLAKEAGSSFGEVYASTGGVTGADIEKLSRDLSAVMAESAKVSGDAPERLKEDISQVREISGEFARNLVELVAAVETQTEVVEDAASDQKEPVEALVSPARRPGVTPDIVTAPTARAAQEEARGISRREQREEKEKEGKSQKKEFKSLGGMIVSGFEKVIKTFMPDPMMQVGMIVGALYSVKDELLQGLQLVGDYAQDSLTWVKNTWRKWPKMLLDLGTDVGVKMVEGAEWLWKRMSIIKKWLLAPAKWVASKIIELPSALMNAWSSKRAAESVKKGLVGARGGQAAAVPAGAPKKIFEQAMRVGMNPEMAHMYATFAEKDPQIAEEALREFSIALRKGARQHVAHKEAVSFARERLAELPQAQASGEAARQLTIASEQETQTGVMASTAAMAGQGAAEMVGLLGRIVGLLQKQDQKDQGGQEAPSSFDSIGGTDDQGMLLSGAGLAGGGIL